MTQAKSKGERLIEQLMNQLDPDSERFGVLQTARRFKSSWVELGEKLLAVQNRTLFLDWGYDSFEDYCKREIRIKQPTAQKLTQAYHYLEHEEPQLLGQPDRLQPLPDFRAVDLLRRAQEEQTLPAEALSALRQAVIHEALGPTAVSRRMQDLVAATQRQTKTPIEVTGALSALKRLQKLVAQLPELHDRHGDGLARLQHDLEQLLAEPPAPTQP